MTYIAAFRCEDGIVMCADTLETYGDYKNYVEKLARIEDRSFPLAIGGAGIEDLIEPLTQEVLERTRQAGPSTKSELIGVVKECIQEVYRYDLPWLVVKKQHRTPEFLIGAKPKNDDFCILKIKGRRLYPIERHEIIGYGTNYNRYLLKRLYRESLPMSQAVALAVYLVSQSKHFDQGVEGDTRVIVITQSGAYIDEQEWLARLEKQAEEIIPLTDELFLACSDVGLSKTDFDGRIESFVKRARDVRHRHIQFAAERVLKRNFMIDDPYPKFPVGGEITVNWDAKDGPGFQASDEMCPEDTAKVKEAIEWAENKKREMQGGDQIESSKVENLDESD